jgi:hypothetical protein
MSDPIRLTLAGYEPDPGEKEVDTLITIAGRPPKFEATKQDDFHRKAARFYEAQAQALCSALTNSLPGGTIYQLTIKLLEHRTNILRIKE